MNYSIPSAEHVAADEVSLSALLGLFRTKMGEAGYRNV